MSRYYSKRNKAKVWAKTYGVPFAMRRALKLAQLSIAATQASVQISTIGAAFGDAAIKAITAATAMIDFHEAVSSVEFNSGFVIKEEL
jgi:hypothetical protein